MCVCPIAIVATQKSAHVLGFFLKTPQKTIEVRANCDLKTTNGQDRKRVLQAKVFRQSVQRRAVNSGKRATQ